MALVDLDDLTVRAVSMAALHRFGITGGVAGATPVIDLVLLEERGASTAALAALRAGAVNSYRAKRILRLPPGGSSSVMLWVRGVDAGGRELALVELGLDTDVRSPLAVLAGREPHEIGIICVDDSWAVTSMSQGFWPSGRADPSNSATLLELLNGEDRNRLLAARSQLEGTSDSIALTLDTGGSGDDQAVCVVMVPLDGDDLLFLVIPMFSTAGVTADRIGALETHLRAIAREVEASGVLRHGLSAVGVEGQARLDSLTDRQWAVLSRLLRGDRVPTIASDLFLSQSTVRNHLSAIFRRFGVHSQAQLLAELRETSNDLSS